MTRVRKTAARFRKGTITILAAVMSIVLVGMVAFCVDIGYVLSAKEELQRSADASALAACWEFGQRLSDGHSPSDSAQFARVTAVEYAGLNRVTRNPMSIDTNSANDAGGDIVFGYVADFSSPHVVFQTDTPNDYNAVRVRMHKNSDANGEVPYFFAKIFGLSGQALGSQATAAIVRNARGFRAPSDGSNLDLLPFALDLETWNKLVSNNSTDNYSWNPVTKQVGNGSDGFVEVNLYPQGTGSPGNRGTVDIGKANNSTNDIARQILHGVSPQDLADLNKPLELDAQGTLLLNGDTGISAGVKDELTTIVGQPRVIPIFSSVTGNGNNAMYTIVKWQGIRIMDVQLTGSMSKKHVTIQVAPVQTNGLIPSPMSGSSSYVYSPVVLVQ